MCILKFLIRITLLSPRFNSHLAPPKLNWIYIWSIPYILLNLLLFFFSFLPFQSQRLPSSMRMFQSQMQIQRYLRSISLTTSFLGALNYICVTIKSLLISSALLLSFFLDGTKWLLAFSSILVNLDSKISIRVISVDTS